ncbi:MAG: ABC transporter substrate-binding protein [Candidatus Heimdallarchaeaceae archaeon]
MIFDDKSIGELMRRRITLSVIFYFIITFSIVNVMGEETVEPYFNLVLRVNGGGNCPDYGLLIAQNLREIGIEVEIKVEPWVGFNYFDPLFSDEFDMTLSEFSDLKTQDMRNFYTEEGNLNLFHLKKSIPYQNESEAMQNEAVTTTDCEERQIIYYDWQILFMDNILPLLPLFSPRQYMATWQNTLGFDSRWDLADSLPYMEFDGFHEGQESLSEINVAYANWRDLNLLKTDDTSSSFMYSLMAEPVIGWSPDLSPLKTSLVTDWKQVDDSHFSLNMRDNVYWNPSFNITDRNASSKPLDPVITPLLTGLKNGEVSNGTNQHVTAKDAVFTYLAWTNSIVSESSFHYNWISNAYCDPVDELIFHIEIDGDPLTPELEPYVDFWSSLHQYILPEFFLNSSDPTVSYTSSGVECTGFYDGILDTDPWVAYSNSAFGCGKYLLDYYIKNSVTVLQASPYWMGIGAIDGTEQDLDIETLNVRVIPGIYEELAEFNAGRLDLTDLSMFPAKRKQMQADPRFEVQSYWDPGFKFLAFNMKRANIGGSDNSVWINGTELGNYTKACAVRKAICYAIDRGEMNQVIHDGECFIAHRPMLNFYGFYGMNVFPIIYNYDLELAWDWMEAAGYERSEVLTTSYLLSCLSVIILIVYRNKRSN